MFYDWNSFCRGFISSIFLFGATNHVLSKIISHKDERQQWRRINTSTSFIHSILSSVISVYCCVENPKMCTTDLISTFTRNAYMFVSFEIGYFLFDSIDGFRKSSGRTSYEILLHHILIVICFCIPLYLGRFIGYVILSLFLEINSIFLHLRQLLAFWNKSMRDTIYRVNVILNLTTFVVFRFGLMAYLCIWLIMNRSNVTFLLYCIGHFGMLMMTIINLSLFSRLIKSDILSM